jgi:tRNA A37 threonylcarbamoyltransferase TsaD
MNAKQEAKLNMFRATQKHCTDNAAIVATIPAFRTAVNSLNAIVTSIIATTQQEDLVTKGITIDKAVAKKTLC